MHDEFYSLTEKMKHIFKSLYVFLKRLIKARTVRISHSQMYLKLRLFKKLLLKRSVFILGN